MQMNRLFEIVYLLMERKNMTAKELAERFEVSTRTIYRDIDTLSAAGIPVYASRGTGGGVRLMDEFVLNKSCLSEQEQNEILAVFQGMEAIRVPDVQPMLAKLGALFGREQASWIDVDFAAWGGGEAEREKFKLLRECVLQKRVLTFEYYGSDGEKTERIAEPLKILFKGAGWYLYSFCRSKQDYRIFKLTRMNHPRMLEERFERPIPDHVFPQTDRVYASDMMQLKLRFDASLAFRVYDEFNPEKVVRNPDGSLVVETAFPPGDWVCGFLLSYGDGVTVLEPEKIRNEIAGRAEKIARLYR